MNHWPPPPCEMEGLLEEESAEVGMHDTFSLSARPQVPLRGSYHEFFRSTPQQMAQPSATPRGIEVLRSRGLVTPLGRENINPNVPSRTRSPLKRAAPAQQPLRKTPYRRTAPARAPSRAAESLFSPNPRQVSFDEVLSSIGESADMPDDDDDEDIPLISVIQRHQTQPQRPAMGAQPIYPVARTIAEGHALRTRVQMGSRIYPGCALTTEEAVACFAVAMVNTTLYDKLTCDCPVLYELTMSVCCV